MLNCQTLPHWKVFCLVPLLGDEVEWGGRAMLMVVTLGVCGRISNSHLVLRVLISPVNELGIL